MVGSFFFLMYPIFLKLLAVATGELSKENCVYDPNRNRQKQTSGTFTFTLNLSAIIAVVIVEVIVAEKYV